MALAYETNTDLAFDTEVLIQAGKDYAKVAEDLNALASDLDETLELLAQEGWSTPAGTAFYKMTQNGWQENIGKYVDLLNTLNEILTDAANQYNELMESYVRVTSLKD